MGRTADMATVPRAPMMASGAVARESAALEKRALDITRREMTARLNAKRRELAEKGKELAVKAKKKVDAAADNSRIAVGVVGGGRVTGMVLESGAKRKLSEKNHSYVGPVAMVGAIAGYVAGMFMKPSAGQLAVLGTAAMLDGAASRFVIKTLDGMGSGGSK